MFLFTFSFFPTLTSSLPTINDQRSGALSKSTSSCRRSRASKGANYIFVADHFSESGKFFCDIHGKKLPRDNILSLDTIHHPAKKSYVRRNFLAINLFRSKGSSSYFQRYIFSADKHVWVMCKLVSQNGNADG